MKKKQHFGVNNILKWRKLGQIAIFLFYFTVIPFLFLFLLSSINLLLLPSESVLQLLLYSSTFIFIFRLICASKMKFWIRQLELGQKIKISNKSILKLI